MSKNTFELNNDEIHIFREGWSRTGVASYREDYYRELTSVTWTKVDSENSDNAYLRNGRLGTLHRYMMAKWYGEDVLADMTARGWVVDHMNNNGMDCRISNLEFLAKPHNTAKGQTFDVDSKRMQPHIALNVFKDFSTQCYQITIGFNDNVSTFDPETQQYRYVNRLRLLYDCDYRMVVLDAEKILVQYENERRFTLEGLSCVDYKNDFAPVVQLTDQEIEEIEKGRCFIYRDGVPLLVLGKEYPKIVSVPYEKGWNRS